MKGRDGCWHTFVFRCTYTVHMAACVCTGPTTQHTDYDRTSRKNPEQHTHARTHTHTHTHKPPVLPTPKATWWCRSGKFTVVPGTADKVVGAHASKNMLNLRFGSRSVTVEAISEMMIPPQHISHRRHTSEGSGASQSSESSGPKDP